MAIRTILHYPDKRLRNPGQPVTEFGPELSRLVEDMAETMYAAPGVGLAATQIGEPVRVFVIDIATGEDDPSELRVFVNPEIVERRGEQTWEEGCLSFPGVHEDVARGQGPQVLLEGVGVGDRDDAHATQGSRGLCDREHTSGTMEVSLVRYAAPGKLGRDVRPSSAVRRPLTSRSS